MWLSLYVLLFINIPGWTGQVKSVCFLLTAFLTYENNLFYCSRLFPTFPRDHRVLLLRVGEGWCVLFWSVEKLVHFIATAALPRTVTELCNRNIKSYIYRERCTPKQWNRPKIQVCFPVTACTEFYAFWSILHLPTLKCFFFFVLFSNKAEEVENQTTIEEVEWLTTEWFLSRPPQKVLLMLHPLIHLSGTQCRLETHFSDIT